MERSPKTLRYLDQPGDTKYISRGPSSLSSGKGLAVAGFPRTIAELPTNVVRVASWAEIKQLIQFV
jgi:hypothetical protein